MEYGLSGLTGLTVLYLVVEDLRLGEGCVQVHSMEDWNVQAMIHRQETATLITVQVSLLCRDKNKLSI